MLNYLNEPALMEGVYPCIYLYYMYQQQQIKACHHDQRMGLMGHYHIISTTQEH